MGAGWQVFRTIASAPFQDDETMDALARGEHVGMWTGKPSGRSTWGSRGLFGRRPRWEQRK